jgi:hypothetical protein
MSTTSREEEEAGRERNNENGQDYPTPRQDIDAGLKQQWEWLYLVDFE